MTSVEEIDDVEGRTIRTVASAPTLPRVVTEVRLPRKGSRVQVTVTLDKTPELAKESVYVAFPFLARRPRVRYARQVGVVDPVTDHLPGAGNEWICTGDWLAVTDETDGHTIAWASADAPLVTVGDVVRGTWPATFRPDGLLLSWVMNNHWFTNSPPWQGGQLTLAYAFEPMASFDPVRAHRMGRELRLAPLVRTCRPIDKFGRAGGPLAPAGRLLEVTCSRNVEAVPVSGPLDAAPMLRVRELAGRPGEIRTGGEQALIPCHPVTGIALGAAVTRAALGPWAVATFRIIDTP